MFDLIDFSSERPAILLGNRHLRVSYRRLGAMVDRNRFLLRKLGKNIIAFQFANNSVSAVASYLACLAEAIPLGLNDPNTSRERILNAYDPTALILPQDSPPPEDYVMIGQLAGSELTLWYKPCGPTISPHPNLALLLSTSGSTGNSKYVRLSKANLSMNASSIIKSLQIEPVDIAILSLSLNYSYGLSIVNSHLAAGACIAISGYPFIHPDFWKTARDLNCSSFAGVPYMYETLHRMNIDPIGVTRLRTLTQAGGRLNSHLITHYCALAKDHGHRFYVMYGQTEATARISVVPTELLPEKIGSIGIPVSGGKLWLEESTLGANHLELYYSGPNVMMGYSQGYQDLCLSDLMGGVLPTGDLAISDNDGFYYITGRISRFAKLCGKRIALADIEIAVEKAFFISPAAVDFGDKIILFIEKVCSHESERIAIHITKLVGIPQKMLEILVLEKMPLLPTGKIDYEGLRLIAKSEL